MIFGPAPRRRRTEGRLAEAVEGVTNAHPMRVTVDCARRPRRSSPRRSKTSIPPSTTLSARHALRRGSYHDTLDFDALHQVLLDPLGRAKSEASGRRTRTQSRRPADVELNFDKPLSPLQPFYLYTVRPP